MSATDHNLTTCDPVNSANIEGGVGVPEGWGRVFDPFLRRPRVAELETGDSYSAGWRSTA